jgi:hypothetical protein
MDEEALKYSYQSATKGGYKGSIDDYRNLLSTDKEALDYAYNEAKSGGYKDSIDDFSTLLGVSSKKKEDTAISSANSTESHSETSSSDLSSNQQNIPIPSTQPKQQASAETKQWGDRFMPPTDDIPTMPVGVIPTEQPIESPTLKEFGDKNLVPELPEKDLATHAEQLPTKDFEGEKTFFTPLQATKLANDYNVSPATRAVLNGVSYLLSVGQDVKKEEKINPKTLGYATAVASAADFVDDTLRALGTGTTQGESVKPNLKAMYNGKYSDPQTLKDFVTAAEALRNAPESKEMQDYQKTVEENNGSFFGVMKGLAQNPSVATEITISSLKAMMNTESLKAAGGVIGASAATGAATGAVTGAAALSWVPIIGSLFGAGTGGVTGAITGAVASIPYAFAAAGATLETASSFADFLREELGDKPFTEENVKAVLDDPDKLSRIRTRALTRGATIGVIDAFTGKLAGKVGARILAVNPAKTGAAALAGAVISASGGMGGEAAAQGLSGQKMNLSDIVLEGIGEMPTGVVDVVAEVANAPKYMVNGERVSHATVQNILESGTGEELQQINFDIQRDKTGLNEKIQDKIVTGQIRKEVSEASPHLSEEQVDKVTALEKDLRANEGNTTQVGKDRVKAIKAAIAAISENPTASTETAPTTEESGKPQTNQESEKVRENRRTDLFPEESEFANVIGNSGKNSNLSNYSEVNGVGVAEYTNPDNGLVDVIMSGTSDNDYVGYVRVYENGKPTNRFTSKMSNESGNKANFKTMITEVQSRLPANHEYTESTSISLDGVRVFADQLNRGYEIATDQNGNPITNNVTLNRASVEGLRNETDQDAKQKLYNDLEVESREEFDTIKEKILKMLPQARVFLNQANNKVQISLPVLRKVNTSTNANENINTQVNEVDQEVSDFEQLLADQGIIDIPTEEAPNTNTQSSEQERIQNITDPEERKVEEIKYIMANLFSGVGEAAANKIKEYADRILSGQQTREQVISGLPKSFVNGIDAILEVNNKAQLSENTQTETVTETTNTDNGVPVSDKVKVDELTKVVAPEKVKIIEAAKRAVKTLKSILPNFDIVVHDTVDSYNAAMSNIGGQQNTKGNFSYQQNADGTHSGRIDINLQNANSRTVAHEVAHAVLLKAFGDNPTVFKNFRKKLSAILSDSTNAGLNKFASMYDADVSAEEYLAELTAMLSNNQGKIEPTIWHKIAALVNTFVSKLTNGAVQVFKETATTKDVIDFFNSISSKINQGQHINIAENKLANSVNRAQLPVIANLTDQKGVASFNKKIEGGFLNKEESANLQKEIESNYNDKGLLKFGNADNDIRTSMYNYDNPLLERDVNGVNLRGAAGLKEGVGEGRRKTYLLYADGEIVGKFYSVDDIKKSVKFIEENLVKNVPTRINRSQVNEHFYEIADDINKKIDEIKSRLETIREGGDVWAKIEKFIVGKKFNAARVKSELGVKVGKNQDISPSKVNRKSTVTIENLIEDILGREEFTKMGINDNDKSDIEKMVVGYVLAQGKYETVEQGLRAELRSLDRESKAIERNIKLSEKQEAENAKAGAKAASKEPTLLQAVEQMTTKEELVDTFTKQWGLEPAAAENLANEYLDKKAKETKKSGLTEQIIKLGREKGYSDETLQTVLKRQGIHEREIARHLGEVKPKPKVEVKIKPEPKKVVVDEMKALKDQLRLEAKAAREAKADVNTQRKMIGKVIAAMETAGKITTKQAQALISKLSNLNVDNIAQTEKFFQYAEKVFADAEYGQKLSTARKNISQLKKLAKNKIKDINLRQLAREFLEVDPSMVENIDEYNAMADEIKESLTGSKINSKDASVRQTQMVSNQKVMDYVWREVALQNEAKKVQAENDMREMMGVDPDGLTYDQMQEMLADDKESPKKYENIIRAKIQQMFDSFSAVIDSMLNQNEDPFTYEPLSFTDSEKKTIRAFMDMDLSLLTDKEALQAVDALNNFIVNRSTAGMDAVVGTYTGRNNAVEVKKKGIVAQLLRLYWNRDAGQVTNEQAINISVMFERLFKGVTKGLYVEKMMGVRDFLTGCATALRESNAIAKEYVDTFYKAKANGEEFNTAKNAIERGMVAFMIQHLYGTDVKKAEEFSNRKEIVKKSIEKMKKGSAREQEKAAIYEKAYEKLVENANNIDDVRAAADPTNLQAIDFWIDKWDSKFDRFSDLSERIYNKILDKYSNYTPERYAKLEQFDPKTNIADDESAFHQNNGTVYKKESGSLKERAQKKSFPEGRYLDLSFDKVNVGAMQDALTDLETAQSIRQIDAFQNSSEFEEIIPDHDDRMILKSRIANLVAVERGKTPFEKSAFNSVVKGLVSILGNIGAATVLGGITQAPKQLTAFANTFVNTKGRVDLAAGFNKAKMDFVRNSGHSIANRGVKSQADVTHINQLLDYAAKSKGEKMLKAIGKVSDGYMKLFLEKPDVFAARVAWLSYYEQSLRKQDINVEGFETRPVNEKAADFASSMVDRNLNTSDPNTQGLMFTDKDGFKRLTLKALLPFASFRLNATARLNSDVITLTSKTSNIGDKKLAAKSAAATLAEIAIFTGISTAIGHLIAGVTRQMMGRKDSDDDEKKRWEAERKGAYTRATGDLLSPLPLFDKVVAARVNDLLDIAQELADVKEKDRVSLYDKTSMEVYDLMGSLGISFKRADQLVEVLKLVKTGEYKDQFGKVHQITEKDREFLQKYAILASVTSTVGLAPSEVDGFVRNAIKTAKKGVSEEKKADKVEKKQTKEEMLYDQENDRQYKTQTEMERYNKTLYDERFGVNSPNYEAEQAQRDAEKEAAQEEQKSKDESYGYKKPTRETKKRNSRW